MVGLALVAVFAMAAVVATSASALPEFGQCFVQAKHEGKFTNAGCTVKAKKVSEKFTGEFEWRKETEVANKGTAGESGTAVLSTNIVFCLPSHENLEKCRAGEEEATLPISLECEKEVNQGQITGSKEFTNLQVTFEGCKVFGSTPCGNTSVEGQIQTFPLKGKLGYINKATKPRQVGVLLEPKTKPEFARFTCSNGSLGTVVSDAKSTEFPAYPPSGGGDGIISPIIPVNTMTTSFEQVYSVTAENENIPSKFEGTAPLKVLEDYLYFPFEQPQRSKWAKAGEALTNIQHPCASTKGTRSCVEGAPESLEAGEIKAN
jgi:hypothetical protein